MLVPVVEAHALPLRLRGVRSHPPSQAAVAAADLLLDRARAADRLLEVRGLDERRVLHGGEIAGGPEQPSHLPEPQGERPGLTVPPLRPPVRLGDELLDGAARGGGDPPVGGDLLGAELNELVAVRLGVRHGGLQEDLIAVPRDARAQRGEDPGDLLDVACRHEDEVARDVVHPDGRPAALGVAPADGEAPLLHGGQDEALQRSELGKLVDEEHALVGLVDAPRQDPVVREGPELRVPAVRIVPNVPEKLGLARPGGHHEGVAVELHQHLPRALALHLAAALERGLVEHLDHLAGALVGDDLLEAVAQARRPDGLGEPALAPHRDLQDPSHQVAEGVPGGVRVGDDLLEVPAARAVPLRGAREEAAPGATVAQALGHRGRDILRAEELPLEPAGALALGENLRAGHHLHAGSLRILRVVDDADLLFRPREMQGEGLGRHGLPDARRPHQEQMPALEGRDAGELDGPVLPDDPV